MLFDDSVIQFIYERQGLCWILPFPLFFKITNSFPVILRMWLIIFWNTSLELKHILYASRHIFINPQSVSSLASGTFFKLDSVFLTCPFDSSLLSGISRRSVSCPRNGISHFSKKKKKKKVRKPLASFSVKRNFKMTIWTPGMLTVSNLSVFLDLFHRLLHYKLSPNIMA